MTINKVLAQRATEIHGLVQPQCDSDAAESQAVSHIPIGKVAGADSQQLHGGIS